MRRLYETGRNLRQYGISNHLSRNLGHMSHDNANRCKLLMLILHVSHVIMYVYVDTCLVSIVRYFNIGSSIRAIT